MNPAFVYLKESRTATGVLTLTFSRPDQLNAMNRVLMTEIISALESADADAGVRVIVLTGAGRAFMAGADLKEYAAQTQAEFDSFQTLGRRLYAAIEGNTKPVVAAINGHCFGGGFEIALACDLLLAASAAKCGLPEINLALIPGGGGTPRLAQRAGLGRALDLTMTGRVVLAEELQAWGVVNRIFPAAEFAVQTALFAEELATKEPAPLQMLKRLARQAVPALSTAILAAEGDALGRFYASVAGRAKIGEFIARSEARKKTPTSPS